MRRQTSIRTILTLLAVSLLLAACAGQPARQRSATSRIEDAAGPGVHTQARHRLLYVAEDMLGTPYHYGGASPSRGFDCSGLVYFSFRQIGIKVPRTVENQWVYSRPVSLQALHPGDLVFFKLTGAKSSHVGIYAGHGEFIHAPSSGERVMRSSLTNPYWRTHLVGAGSFL